MVGNQNLRSAEGAGADELAHELSLLGDLETGKCRLEIDSRHHTVTIKNAKTGEILFHTSIADYEELLKKRDAEQADLAGAKNKQGD